MKKSDLVYVIDIENAIHKIFNFVSDLDVSDFSKNEMLQDAIIKNLTVIGEASTKIDEKFKLKYANVEWIHMKNMRNKLVQDYDGVDLKILWSTIKNDLPDLHLHIKEIIKKEEND